MNRATVGFVYNHPCPLKCNFCCHTQEIVGPGRASPDNIGPALQRFAKEESVTRFAFTGGDPFLYLDEIVSIMALARRCGVKQPFHMVTSGFWANSQGECDRLLAQLSALQMDILYVSHDKEHAKWVSAEQVGWIAESCKLHNVKLRVYGVFWTQEDRQENLLPNLQGVPILTDLVVSIGRARERAGEAPRYGLPDEAKYTCRHPRDYDVTIYPNGDVYPCCSGGFNKEAKLLCGNAFADSPRQILETVYGMFHARIAKEIGFDTLYARVKRDDPELFKLLPAFASVDSVCQICRDLRLDPSIKQRLERIYESLEIDYVLRCIDEHDAHLDLFATST